MVVLGRAVIRAHQDGPRGFPKHQQSKRGGTKVQNKPRRVCKVPHLERSLLIAVKGAPLATPPPLSGLVETSLSDKNLATGVAGLGWVETRLIVLKGIVPSYSLRLVREEVVAPLLLLQGLNKTMQTTYIAQ